MNFKLRSGQIVIVSILFLSIGVMLASAIFGRTANYLRFGGNTLRQEQAINLADAGVDYAMWQLNETLGSFTGPSTVTLSGGAFTTQVQEKSPPNPQLKTVVATGFIPDAINPREKQKVKVDVFVGASANFSFHYAVQIGGGGVNLANSSIIHGNVYSNANITGSGTSTIEGDAYAAGTISSPDPFVTGTKYPESGESEMPNIDYQFWKDAANINNNPITCSPTCTINTSQSIGPQKYMGNLEITNNVTVTINGPVHVTGNFTISQGGTRVKLNDAFCSNGTVLIVDGTVSYTQGGTFEPTNCNPKGYLMVITTSVADPAVEISQSGATAVFYALEGGASLSQSADVTALVAKTLNMSQSAELTYDTGLASAQFSTGPGGAWQIKRGTYLFK